MTMKKFLLSTIVCLIAFASNASDIYRFRTTDLATKTYNYTYGYWNDWSDWEDCNVSVTINFNNDRITIYSSKTQIYYITEYNDIEYDNDGSRQLTFNCLDDDGLRCDVRYRIQEDGQKQLYVDYNDMMWVYNIIER